MKAIQYNANGHIFQMDFRFSATESEISRSSAPSSRDSKKTKEKSKTPTKSADLNIEDNFDNGFKISQSMFLPEIKLGVDE